MADKDWLNIDGNATGARAQMPSHEVEVDFGIVSNGVRVAETETRKGGWITRRCLGLSLIGVALVVATAVGLSLTVFSPQKQQGDGSINNNNSNNNNFLDDSGNPVAQVINGVARQGGNEFRDENSYQSRAKKWVLTQDVDDDSIAEIVQLYAVACIYYATFSQRSDWTDVHYSADVTLPGWYSALGWLSSDSVCNWHGLTCNSDGKVSKIQLNSNGLTGSFPPEVVLLKDTLTTIDLFDNMIHNAGVEGNDFLGELTNLQHLYYRQTFFEYNGIPTVLGKLTALEELDVSETLYFGKLDGRTFANLSNLRYLSMSGNAYNSSLPTELVGLPNLEYLYADFSFLEGGLDFLTKMPQIREVFIADNPGLKGTLSPSLAGIQNLASLSATNCGITGTLPKELGSMMNMIQLWLDNNQLTGTIPSELGNMVTLKTMELHGNQLEGEMPSTICGRRRPFGRLETLGADCESKGTITCAEDCCTCCGEDCGI